MKIVSIEVLLSDEPAVDPAFVWRHGLPGSEPARTAGWLVITTDDGMRGYAPCARGLILADLVDRRLRTELVGADPLRREWLWHRMWELDRIETFPTYVIGVIDDALWDIAGKASGEPVHRLIGSFRDSIPAYASTVTYRSVEEYLDVADQCLDLGYSAIKLHAWGDPHEDAKLITALREHVGDDVPLMYDGSAGFDLMDAVHVGRALGDAGYLWYEEPMREFNITAYKWLAERVTVPLLVAEVSAGSHMSTADFIASGCASAVRTGTGLRGGITGALRTAHLADSFHLRAEVHGMGLPNTHLCMSIPNTTYFESLVSSNPVTRGPEVDAFGLVHAPTGPGMGYEQQWGSDAPPIVSHAITYR
jgi:L-alanine-DL-glutamate epimerase-like enolase superfamily enzyme